MMSRNVFAMSMNNYGWGQFDVAQCLEQIKKTPIRKVELPAAQTRPNAFVPEIMLNEPMGGAKGWKFSIPDLKDLLARGGFETDSVDVFGKWLGKKGENLIKTRIDFAADLGAPFIVLGMPHELTDETRNAHYALVREMADHAATRNVRIALEIHGGMMRNAQEISRTMQEVGGENVGVNWDTANIVHYNPDCDWAAELKAVARHVIHVHLKDIKRDGATNRFKHPRLGEGMINFRKVFDILHSVDFYGPFSFELETFHGATITDDIAVYHEDVLASFAHLESIGEFNS
ncbi:MAG: sugar phosphate isomerase/epimerase family protein [Planctomycetota bacterium]